MKSRDFARAIVTDLRARRLSPATIAEYARCAAIVHAGDHFDFQRYGTKLLHRHRNRPGPKPDLEHDKRMIEAIYWVRFNRRSLGVAKAIELAAKQFRVRENVLRDAYNGKIPKFRKLKPRIAPPK